MSDDPKDPSVAPPGYEPPTSAEELLERYASGERYFVGAQIPRGNFTLEKIPGVNFARSDLFSACFGGTDLENATFDGCSLLRSDFSGPADGDCHSPTQLSGASFRHAQLASARFAFEDLSQVSLRSANLVEVDFSHTNLSKADLSHSRLVFALFNRTIVADTDFTGAHFGETIISEVDLSQAVLASIEHERPSTVGIDALHRTAEGLSAAPRNQGSIEVFLQGCGLTDYEIDHFRFLVGKPIDFYSCFISHSTKDKPFARKLHDALQARGIRCWFDEKSLLPGDDLYEGINRGIRLYDKLLLVCSKDSLKESWWVDNEIVTALEKEQRLMKERGEKVLALIPVDLDGFLFSDEVHGKAATIRTRVAANFRGCHEDEKKFEMGLDKLAEALRAGRSKRDKPPETKL